jgi:tetratricopeptide (TPR) repeat protein
VAVSLVVLVAVILFAVRPRSSSGVAAPAAPPLEVPVIGELGTLDRAFAAAVEEEVAAVRRDRGNGEAYGRLGRLYHAHGYLVLARRCYEIARRLSPQTAAWPYYLGVLATGRGQTGEAIESLRQALSLDPDYLATYFRLGNLLLADGQLDAAEEMYATLVLRAGEESWGYLGRGKVARRRGRLSEAAELLEQAVARAADDREGAYLLAMTYRELGKQDVARRQLDRLDRKARAWPPDPLVEVIPAGRRDLQPLIQMASRLLADGNAEDAAKLYRAVLDSDPAHFDALYNLGVVYSRQGRWAEAKSSFEAAIRSRPDHADVHFALAVTYASLEQREKAEAEVATVLRLDPEHAGARSLFAGRSQ